MNEAQKTLKYLLNNIIGLLTGKGIDIGCGEIPVIPSAQPFDMAHGDANKILEHIDGVGGYDFVYSSHCLEHMYKPYSALADWWALVKPDGVMMFAVPDEDLYEQGYWPSIFNGDHKHTFTLSKMKSWSPASINIIDLVSTLTDVAEKQYFLMDNLYERDIAGPRLINSHRAIRLLVFKNTLSSKYPLLANFLNGLWAILRLPIDQTLNDGVLAQIFVLVKKSQTTPSSNG